MSHTLWMCFNCDNDNGIPGRPFEAAKGAKVECPRCGLSRSESPSHIVKREVIHLELPHPKLRGKGNGKRACDGKPTLGAMASGHPSAITCLDCLKTEAFSSAAEKFGYEVSEEKDYTIQPVETPAVPTSTAEEG